MLRAGASIIAGLLIASALPAFSQSQFPNKPIRMIVPQAPGSATDTIARLVAAEMGNQLNQNIIIENKPGAAFTIGLDIVAKAPADGYTIGIGPVGALAISPNMVERLPYDLETDFQPIALISARPLAACGRAEFRFQVGQGSGGLGEDKSRQADQRLVGERLARPCRRRTFQAHDQHRNRARALSWRRAAINDLIAGRVDFMFESLNSISPHAKSGNVRALGVSGDRRSPAFPDLPTVAEAGVPGYGAPTWSGIIGPAGLPRDALAKLNEALNRAVSTPAFKERFGQIGDEPAGGTPEEFATVMRVELAKWKDVVQRSGAKMQ